MMRVRAVGVGMLLLGCARPADGDDESASVCMPAVCGDGVVGLDEPCDGADGCAPDCRRDGPSVVASMESAAWSATFDVDGSVLVVSSGSPYSLARLAPDGTELWRTPIDGGGDGVMVVGVRVGTQILVVGSRLGGQPNVGALWRFDPDGTPRGRIDDDEERDYVDAVLASNGDTALLVGSLETFGTTVERRSADGTLLWTRAIDPQGAVAAHRIALVADDVVLGVGGNVDTGAAAIVRATADDVTHTVLSATEQPDAYFYAVAADGSGGAIALGVASDRSLVAGVDGDGGVKWINECSSSRVVALDLVIAGDRILVGGRRYLPEDCGSEGCVGVHGPWVQHLALDGTVIARDAPDAIVTAVADLPAESVLAITRDEQGHVIVLGAVGMQSSYLARFPW